MNGFIYRRAGVLLSTILAFNAFGIFANASETELETASFEEELEISDELSYDDYGAVDEEMIDIIEESEPESEDYSGDTYPDEQEDVTPDDEYEEPATDDTDYIIDYDDSDCREEENSQPQEDNNTGRSAGNKSNKESDPEEYFTVRYVCEENDVTDIPMDDNIYKKGDIVMISYLEPIREGYSFWGWSFTGDSSCVYSAGYTFEITEDVTLYATWAVDEYFYENERNLEIDDFSESNPIVNAINSYVNSLKGRFKPTYKYKGKVKSIQCCAFTDQIWENALGIGRYSTPGNYKIIDSKKKLGKSQIYEFLKANNAQPGDIIWCHDPVSAKKYNITHYMILMGYDKNGITITDGYERNGKGIIWKNNQRVSYTGDHAKYFSGKCYVRIYHVTKTNK